MKRYPLWSSLGMNALVLLMLMAPYADRLTLGSP